MPRYLKVFRAKQTKLPLTGNGRGALLEAFHYSTEDTRAKASLYVTQTLNLEVLSWVTALQIIPWRVAHMAKPRIMQS